MKWDILKRKNPLNSVMFLRKLIEEYFEVEVEEKKIRLCCSDADVNKLADELIDVKRLVDDRLLELSNSKGLDLEDAFNRHSIKMHQYKIKHDWEIEESIDIKIGGLK